jgi:hypothetical protein
MNSPSVEQTLAPRPASTAEQDHGLCADPVERIRPATEKRHIRKHYESVLAQLEAEGAGDGHA